MHIERLCLLYTYIYIYCAFKTSKYSPDLWLQQMKNVCEIYVKFNFKKKINKTWVHYTIMLRNRVRFQFMKYAPVPALWWIRYSYFWFSLNSSHFISDASKKQETKENSIKIEQRIQKIKCSKNFHYIPCK